MPRRRRARFGWTALTGIVVLVAAAGAHGQQDPLCPYFAGCEFEAPGFTIRVVDERTGEPVPDAHVMAVWVVYGMYGREAPLMAIEAVSEADGGVTFHEWGPRRGGSTGLVPGRDPAISIFKPGYRALLVVNPTPLSQELLARVHPFHRAGQAFALVPFQGTAAETIAELRKAAYPLPYPSTGTLQEIRDAYVHRYRRVRAELERLPRDTEVNRFLRRLDEEIQAYRTGGDR